TVAMMTLARFAAIEMIAGTADRTAKRRRAAGSSSALAARRSAGLRIAVAAMIPNRTVIAGMIPASMSAMVVAVMIMIVTAIMIVMMVVMVTEEAQAPSVKPDESIVRVEIVVLGRTEPVDAGIAGPVTFPLVATPV